MIYKDNQQIDDIVKSFIQSKLNRFYDFTYSYLAINKKDTSKIKIISNYPLEWIELYKKNKFHHIDHIVLSSLNRITPFSWDENLNIKSGIIFNSSKKFNIQHGFTFVLHDSYNNLALLSLLIKKDENYDLEAIIEENKDKIQMVILNSHDKILSLYRESLEINCINTSQKTMLSQRENDILYWSSIGKTYQDIALILDIKVCTVKLHMSKVVKKLGVLNAKHAIRLGIELNIIITPWNV